MNRRPSTFDQAGKGVPRFLLATALLLACVAQGCATPAVAQADMSFLVTGTVVDLAGRPVAGASVTLHQAAANDVAGKTDASGAFGLKSSHRASYEVIADTADHRHGRQTAAQPGVPLRIVVEPMVMAASAIEFSDKPDFTVAGVTDWTAVGGHGSDATLRTSEDITRQTAALKTSSPPPGATAMPPQAGHSQDSAVEAESHRLAGERDEKLGDPLGAAREEEQAAVLNPSEQNYFTWGSELLLHRAIWQAAEVFAKGARLHPESQRLQTGWGAALFAGAKYDDAAAHLCMASDLDPASRETYLLLGKLGLGSPSPEACVSEKLARFLRMHPDDTDAIYYKAMLLLKEDPIKGREQAAELLRRVVALHPGFAEGYLQLGILALARHDNAAAQEDFEKAIAADPSLAEAHFRLGVVYDRMGHPEQAKVEFARHEALAKEQADEVEQERRQVKQFLVVLGGTAPGASAP